jgi:EAL domain-containing protein (putative c-di-GMP-specific phosphodiesterase class I)
MTMNYSFLIPSLLILILIMGYYFFRPRLPIRLNRSFLAILTIDICTEIFEAISSRLNETCSEHAPWLLWLFGVLFFFFYFSRAYMFFVFTISILDARGISRSRLHVFTPVVYYFCALLALTSPFTGWLFRVENGYQKGPVYFLFYVCCVAYILFSQLAAIRHRKELTTHEFISISAIQVILLIGIVVRALVPNWLVMNTFCLMAIIVIFLSFLNPDLYMSERGYVYNLPAFQALVSECVRRRRPCRILAFALQNYNEHREIFGGAQMDEALVAINRYLADSFRQMSPFYLRNGFYALVGQNLPDLDALRDSISQRFASPWKTSNGELRMTVAFVEADTEILDCPADRLVNALFLSLDELGRASDADSSRSLTDSIEQITERLEIRRCLEHALDHDELEVFLQPIVDTVSGKRIAAEALVRLRDGQGKIIRPDLFITLAEREGYIARLGEQVLSKVCRFIHDHDMDAMGVRWINVNLSPLQFMSRDIPARFTAILRQYGVSTDRIHLEITEQSMIDFSLMRDQIMDLHSSGFEFALDDYGSGYSNLTRVRRYPFTNIKIDMEVVRNYYRDRDPLLPALIQAFKKMKFTITAEGIETADMAEAIKEIGCDYLQGYYFSRPVPMPEFAAM